VRRGPDLSLTSRRGVTRVGVPASIREISRLARIDYADAFLTDVGDIEARSAEGWARAVVEGAPQPLRASLVSGWTSIGLRIALPGTDGTVLGWRIRRSDPDVVVLAAESRIGMPAELVFRRDATRLLFSTLVEKGNPAAVALWMGVEPVHLRVVPNLLGLASRRFASRRH
jgi:hypothetical protein